MKDLADGTELLGGGGRARSHDSESCCPYTGRAASCLGFSIFIFLFFTIILYFYPLSFVF